MPQDLAEHTERNLRRAGADGYEMFVLWSGLIDGPRFEVRTGHVPHQTASRSEKGLSVRVEGEALHGLNVWLCDRKEVLGAQIHAHPTDAYHSDTDDTFPIVTVLGGLSLVVPDFCRAGLLAGSAAYRLTEDGWTKAERAIDGLIEVV